MKPRPKATIEEQSPDEILWKIVWPPSHDNMGSTYYAAENTQTSVLRILTSDYRLPAASGIAERLTPAIQKAIGRAKLR